MKKRLTRSTTDKMIEGVCGGLAEYLGVDSTIVRLVFAAGLVFGFGSFGVLYLIMWAIVPKADSADADPPATVEQGDQEMGEKGRQVVDEVKTQMSGQKEKGASDTTSNTASDTE